jgi:hypothetical protein
MKVADPELTTDGIALRKPSDEQFHQLALLTRRELAV